MCEELSMGREAEMDALVERAGRDALLEQQARDCSVGIWRTRDGLPVHVSAMHEAHLRNALAMLRRNGFIGEKTLAAYFSGPLPRGEMAKDAYDRGFEEVVESKFNPYVDLLEAEMKRRGLTEGEP